MCKHTFLTHTIFINIRLFFCGEEEEEDRKRRPPARDFHRRRLFRNTATTTINDQEYRHAPTRSADGDKSFEMKEGRVECITAHGNQAKS